MNTIKLSDINLYDIGNEVQISGTIFSGKGRNFIITLPEKEVDYTDLDLMPLTLEEWQILRKQMDILETEIFSQDSSGITKDLVRKSQRQIDNYLQWECFRRDDYTCRYCGRTGIPLTVDHVDLWEDGGATIIENLITACRACNKDRGRMPYESWIKSDIYKRKSTHLSPVVQQENLNISLTLEDLKIKRVKNIRSR